MRIVSNQYHLLAALQNRYMYMIIFLYNGCYNVSTTIDKHHVMTLHNLPMPTRSHLPAGLTHTAGMGAHGHRPIVELIIRGAVLLLSSH
jgi:hypothetical protein